jgi:hypothetical protein
LPTLVEAKFLGGEPMLIRLYHLIWERIRAVNPNIVLSITTNGTVIPERALAALAGLRCHICVSIDSLDVGNYARIRKHGSLDVVLANFEFWREHTRAHGTGMSIAVCPMTYNWRELPDFLRFSEQHDVPVAFNTVVRPWAASLASLTHEELDEVIAHLGDHQPAEGTVNAAGWCGVIEQVRAWRDTRRVLEGRFGGFIGMVRTAARSQSSLLAEDGADAPPEMVADAIARLLASSWLDRARTVAQSQAALVDRDGDGDRPQLFAEALERQLATPWTDDDPADRELASRLAQMTPVAPDPGEHPVQQATLLRAMTLLRNIGLLVASGATVPRAVDAERLALDLESIDRLLASNEAPIDWGKMWELVFYSRWDLLADWLTRTLERHPAETPRA